MCKSPPQLDYNEGLLLLNTSKTYDNQPTLYAEIGNFFATFFFCLKSLKIICHVFSMRF